MYEEFFDLDLQSMLGKAKHWRAVTDQVAARTDRGPGVWARRFDLRERRDYLLVVQATEGFDLELLVQDAAGEPLGLGLASGSLEPLLLTVDISRRVTVGVVNTGDQPVRFGLSVLEVEW